jgi:AraC family transcriptional regulator, transcriptional activator of the genes for pyochelin and ferripyochelin receptors
MTRPLTEQEFTELRQQYLHQEITYNTNGFDYIEKIEHQLAKEHIQIMRLRSGLCLEIIDDQCYTDFSVENDHSEYNILVSKFYLSGCHRVLTPNVPEVPDEYVERAGYNYLFFLPDILEIEQFFANQQMRLIRIEVDPNLLVSYITENSELPQALRQLIAGNLEQRFHQTIGRTTPAMQHALQQLSNCPFQGAIKRIYLESKVLELLAFQFNEWTEQRPKPFHSRCSLQSHDIERLHHARDILMQKLDNPPSLLELARQVGLNDYKLKQGFRQLFGTTVFGYLQAHRMKYAKQLLTEQELSIAGVAQLIGYTSQSRFCDAFKRQFGMSPREYRIRLRG